jgi:hypothetical protein
MHARSSESLIKLIISGTTERKTELLDAAWIHRSISQEPCIHACFFRGKPFMHVQCSKTN